MYLYCCSRLQGRDYQESAGQSDPLRLLCQTVTHRLPAKWYLNQSQSGIPPIRDRIERNTQPRQIRVPFRRYRPVMPERLPLCTPFPFDFEFFVAVILLLTRIFIAMVPGYSYEELRAKGYTDDEARRLIREANGKISPV